MAAFTKEEGPTLTLPKAVPQPRLVAQGGPGVNSSIVHRTPLPLLFFGVHRTYFSALYGIAYRRHPHAL